LHTLLKPTKFEYISSAIGKTIFSPIVSACNNLFFFVQVNTVSYCVFRISKSNECVRVLINEMVLLFIEQIEFQICEHQSK
jgi:hypothetical protein